MKDKGRKITAVLLLIGIAMAGHYGWAKEMDVVPAKEQFRTVASRQENRAYGHAEKQEKSEKQRAFEEQLARKNAEFERRYNEAKKKNDAIRQKFDQLEEVNETKLRELLAKERQKRMRK